MKKLISSFSILFFTMLIIIGSNSNVVKASSVVPEYIKSDIILVRLNENGKQLIHALSPSVSNDSPFSICLDSLATLDMAKRFGSIVSNNCVVMTHSENEPYTFDGMIQYIDEVPIVTNGNNLDSACVLGKFYVGQTFNIHVSDVSNDSVKIKSDITLSNIESWSKTPRSTIPVVSALVAHHTENLSFGNGMIIGGFQNVGEIDNKDHFIVFINLHSV